jgi:hypothetical protein
MFWQKYKILFLTPTVFLAVFILSGCDNEPAVKKSNTGICHEKGTLFYKNTKNFTAFDSIEDCLNSGGRLPKK